MVGKAKEPIYSTINTSLKHKDKVDHSSHNYINVAFGSNGKMVVKDEQKSNSQKTSCGHEVANYVNMQYVQSIPFYQNVHVGGNSKAADQAGRLTSGLSSITGNGTKNGNRKSRPLPLLLVEEVEGSE